MNISSFNGVLITITFENGPINNYNMIFPINNYNMIFRLGTIGCAPLHKSKAVLCVSQLSKDLYTRVSQFNLFSFDL